MYSEDPEQTYEEKYNDKDFEANPSHLDGVPEMSALIHLEAPNVLHNLECRYKQSEIYTSISKVLIAVNPYKPLDVYGTDIIQRYRQAASDVKRRLKSDLPPHVFTVAQTSYFNLAKMRVNQSMIVCGESGSGKTESAKHLMRYLAANSKGDEQTTGKAGIENQVLDANPILESFGNAKTVLNNNSSRFGKFTKIVFQSDLVKIAGSYIETYLLEKSRVTKQDLGERNYHIFYMLCRAKALPSWSELGLDEPGKFNYLNQSGTTTADGIDDEAKVTELLGALETLSFPKTDQQELFSVVAAVLHLGNVQLVPDQKEYATPSQDSKATIGFITKLLKIDEQKLRERLTTKKIKVAKETISSRLTVSDGCINREAFAKAIYHGLFQWIVSRINHELYRAESRDESLNWIGILDVFGFESFQHNSFEQFCINFANERLQQYFNGYILLSEQDEYLAEAIKWTPLRVPNNQDVMDLIDKGKNSILGLLDSECLVATSTKETLIQNLFKLFPAHKRLAQVRRVKRPGVQGFVNMHGFSIVHYAGKVTYTVDDFLVKNNDAPSPENVSLLNSSSSTIVKQLLVEEPSGLKSTGRFFSRQLETLMHNLQATTPFFVRCIKPNSLKKPNIFDWKYVRPQLECGGIIEALRILKCGYPTRCTYESIFDRYGHILNPTPPKLNKRDFCEAVLRCCGEGLDRGEFQLGLTKCFFRPGKQEFLEELLQGPELGPSTVIEIKRFLLNKRFQRARGVISSGVCFSFILRRMRAQLHAKRVFAMANVLQNVRNQLTQQRQEIAAIKFQASARAILQNMAAVERKQSVAVVVQFYHYNLTRRTLQAEVSKRIKAKIALLSERERARKEQLAREKAEAKQRELASREQARLDALQKKREEEEAKIKAEKEKVRQEQEQKDRHVKELEEKEREFKARLAQMEEVKLLKDTVVIGGDALAQLLEDGQLFEVRESASRRNSSTGSRTSSLSLGSTTLFLQVSKAGELCWSTPGDQLEKGRVSLTKVTKVVGMKSSPAMFIYAELPEGPICLDLQAPDPLIRGKWCTALQYARRNMIELGTVSRPMIDQMRGNWKCAELSDQMLELKSINQTLEQENADLRVQNKVLTGDVEAWKLKYAKLEEQQRREEDQAALVIHVQEQLILQENESKVGFQKAQEAMREAQRMVDECDKQIQNTNEMLERLGIPHDLPDSDNLDETTKKLLDFRSEQKTKRDAHQMDFEERVAAMVAEAERLNDNNETNLRVAFEDQGKKKKGKGNKDDGCTVS